MSIVSLCVILLKMRVFKNKWFARWSRAEAVSDAILLQAVAEILAGKVEADLEGCDFDNLKFP